MKLESLFAVTFASKNNKKWVTLIKKVFWTIGDFVMDFCHFEIEVHII